MPNVYAVNKTNSSIDVDSWFVYYINNSNAELITVYDTNNNSYDCFKYVLNNTPWFYVLDSVQNSWVNDLSSIGYSLTPAPVLPTVTFSDDISSGTISALTLPSGHSGYYTGVSFDSLRYYVKGTVSDTGSETGYLYGTSGTWHYGTVTWTDESLGDLSNEIAVNPPTSSGFASQTVFKIVFITGGIAGYSPRDTSNLNKGQISQYTYNNGVHSITFYTTVSKWYENTDAGRIMLRYLNGTTTFNNLSAFDLVNVSGGTLSKATTTDRYDMYNTWNDSVTLNARYASCSEQGVTTVTVYNSFNVSYNAFKYTVSGTDYYYVLDGTQTDWTDDLSSIGYSLTPVLVLPTVTLRSDLYISPDSYNHSLGSGNQEYLYERYNGSYRGISYDDTTKKQCVYGWRYYPSGGPWQKFYYGVSAVKVWSSLAVENETQDTINVTNILYAESSDPATTIITVYNSSNIAYNSLKYTADGVDYYYVLDGTQTDWTDDLSGIGYNLIAYTSGSSLESGNTRAMLNSDGTGIVYDTSKTYTVTGLLSSSYESVTSESSFVQRSSIIDDGGYAKYKQTYGRLTGMKYVKYTVS